MLTLFSSKHFLHLKWFLQSYNEGRKLSIGKLTDFWNTVSTLPFLSAMAFNVPFFIFARYIRALPANLTEKISVKFTAIMDAQLTKSEKSTLKTRKSNTHNAAFAPYVSLTVSSKKTNVPPLFAAHTASSFTGASFPSPASVTVCKNFAF